MEDGRSKLAVDLQKLQASVNDIIQRREVLPQPLFWSLFHSRIDRIRKIKHQERIIKAVLYNPHLIED